MRKKNTSDRKKLKTKYFEKKKRTQRKVKLKRDQKKNPNKHHKKKSDPGIPNICPFKKDILAERAAILQLKADTSARRTELEKKARMMLHHAELAFKRKLPETITYDLDLTLKKPRLETDVKDKKDNMNNEKTPFKIFDQKRAVAIMKRQGELEIKQQELKRFKEWSTLQKGYKNHPTRTEADVRFNNWDIGRIWYSEVRKIVSACDVLLEVVDARDPLGTRCSVLETLIKNSPGKKLVLIVNKADLIPKRNLEDWLKYLRVDAPTIAYNAAIAVPVSFKNSIDRLVHIGEECSLSSSSMGSNVLLQLLKHYASSFKFASLTVGVVGFPNVGKGSVIRSLKKVTGLKATPVPGEIKGLYQIKLDKKVYLIDSPGLVLPSEDMSPVEAVLKNVINIKRIKDPIFVAKEIYNRCDVMKLYISYEVRQVDTFEKFLAQMTRSTRVKDGQKKEHIAGALKILYDWTQGNLKHYAEPPKREHADVETKVVSKMSSVMNEDPIFCSVEELFLRSLPMVRPCISNRTVGTDVVENCSPIGIYDEDENNDEDAANDTDDYGATNDPNNQEERDSDSSVEDNNDVSESDKQLHPAIEIVGSDLEED